MTKVAITEQYLTDIADAIRTKTGMSSATYKPPAMANAILTISGSGGITPTGTINITTNGTHNVTQYASANVNVPVGSTINNQDKTVSPSTSQQVVGYDDGYTGLNSVTVNAMPALTLPTSVSSSATSGYSKKVTIGRSTSTQYINIGTGYNSAGGYYEISAVANGSATAASSISGSSATVSTGTNTITLTKTISNTPQVTAGYISSGTAGNSSVSLTASVTTKAAATITPGTTNQTIASGTYLTGTQTIAGSSNLIAGNIKKNVTIFGVTGSYEASGGGSAEPVLQAKTYTVDSAGTDTITADSGYDGLSEVEINVPEATVGDEDYSSGFYNDGNTRKWRTRYWTDYSIGGFIDGVHYSDYLVRNAVPSNTTVTPTESSQTIGGSNYMMEGAVTVNAIPSSYVGSGIARQTRLVTDANYNVIAPAGFYSDDTYLPIPTSQHADPSIQVSNTGLITATHTAELGKLAIGNATTTDTYQLTTRSSSDLTASGATVTVPSGYYASQATKSVSSLTLPTSTSSSATSGYTSKATITPSTSDQYLNIGTGYNSTTSYYKINAMTTMTLPTSATNSPTSGYTSKATIGRSTNDQIINIPPGYNSTGAYYRFSAVANGSASAPTTISGTSATVSTGTNTLTLTKTVSVTPTVSAGYVSSGTATNSSISLTASVTTKAAATITPGTSNQTIASGTYLTGTQTISGDADLIGGNIISTANIFGVQGTVVLQNYYTGSSAPSSSTGSNGDLYLQS